jgi:hypothetical protein
MTETERSVKDGSTKRTPDIDDLSAGPEEAISVGWVVSVDPISARSRGLVHVYWEVSSRASI